MSATGKAQPEQLLSAFTPLATFERTCRDVGLVPLPDIAQNGRLARPRADPFRKSLPNLAQLAVYAQKLLGMALERKNADNALARYGPGFLFRRTKNKPIPVYFVEPYLRLSDVDLIPR